MKIRNPRRGIIFNNEFQSYNIITKRYNGYLKIKSKTH